MRKTIALLLIALLIFQTSSCALAETEKGNGAETTSGADFVNETIMEGATTETFAETVPVDPNADFYARYNQSEDDRDYFYKWVYYYYEPSNRYYGKTSERMVEVAPNVYMGIYDWEFLQEIQTSHADETLIFRFSVFPGDVVDSYFLNENTAETVAQKIRDDEEESATIERATQITDEEFLSIVKAFQYILDENAICYYREDGLPYVYYRDRAYHKYSVTCCMTIEEILSLNIPEGEYITISFYGKCK